MPTDETVKKAGLTSSLTPFLHSMKDFPNQTIHPWKRKPLFAEVFDGGTDVVELFFIDDEESVVDMLNAVKGNGRVLRVVFFHVQAQRIRNAHCVNGGGHPFLPFGELQ